MIVDSNPVCLWRDSICYRIVVDFLLKSLNINQHQSTWGCKLTRRERVVDAGRAESEPFEPDDEVQQEFVDAQRLATGGEQLIRELKEHHSRTPKLSGGDLDAAWDQADCGDETVGGSSPTPDQSVVEELGEALGLTYEDNEPLHTSDKIGDRDRRRWELDPASSEDYKDRVNREGE